MIHVKIDQQSLTAVSDAPLVAKTVGVTTFDAKFPPDWNGYEKFIVFSGPGGMKSVLYTGRSMPVPWEPLDKPGLLRISAVGLAEGKRDVTSKMTDGLLIFENGDICSDQTVSDPTLPPTEQAILLCAKSAKEAQKSEQGAEQALKDAQTAVEDAEKIIEGVKPDIDRLYTALIRDTITGSMVRGKFIAGTPLDYHIDIEVRQNGEGEPSPDNVRAINYMNSVDLAIDDEEENGTVHTIALPETSYGGYIDWKKKKYVQTWSALVLDGTENFSNQQGESDTATHVFAGGPIFSIMDGKKGRLSVCSHLPYKSRVQGRDSWAGHQFNQDEKYSNYLYLKFNKADLPTPDFNGVKLYLAQQYAIGTPVTVAYELTAPVEYDLEDLPALTALNGVTTVYSDTAKVSVTGYMDTKAYIDNQFSKRDTLMLS